MPANWRECALGDLAQIKHGYAFKGEFFGSTGTHVVLTPGNFHEAGGFKERANKAKWYSGPVPDEYVLNAGDLIVAMTEQGEGLLGSSALVPRSGFYLHNQRLGLVTPASPTAADREFLYYLFNSRSVRQQIRASANGAKIRHTSPARIYEVKVRVPDITTQRRIASILSAYDDLIENNTRRIAILEEMARRIYEEWFVRFRFPGHESVRMVESELGLVPEGWARETLADCASVTMGQSPSSEFYNDKGEGLPFHQGVTNFGRHFPTHKMFCSSEGRLAEEGDILVSVRAPVGRINLSRSRLVIGRGLCAVRSRTGQQTFLLHRLFETFKEEDSMGNGAIFKAVSKQEVLGLPFLVPHAPLVAAFEEMATPFWSLIRNLTDKNTNLRTTRDLLLPKLISGELDVSALPEPETVAA
jgi:type I restriction enzyme S subunit